MTEDFDFEIEESKDGYNIVKVNKDNKWRYIGSKYNQRSEIDKFIKSFGNFTENDNYIVFGLSCGEHIRELLKYCYKNSHIIIVETNSNLIEYLKINGYINDILSNDSVVICNNKEEIYNFFNNNINETNIDFLKLGVYSNYINIYNQLVYLYKIVKEQTQKQVLGRNTNLIFSYTWFDTLMNNLSAISQSTPLNYLKDKYKNMPAIIVSAGPSLENNIKELKNINNNALILSGGRTLKSLLKYDINPDCLTVVDPGEVSYKLLENYIDRYECPLLFYEGTNAEVVNNHHGKKIIASHNKFIHNIFNEDIMNINCGGSVAHAMTFFAAYMGCSPIVFVGQDLAYTNNKRHAECATRKNTSNNINDYKVDELYINDIKGQLVRTSPTLNTFRIELEEIIKRFPEIEFIDATEGGAFIEGTKIEILSDVIKKFNNKKITFLDELVIEECKFKKCIKELEVSLKFMKDCNSICKNGQRLLEDFKIAHSLKRNKHIIDINKKLNKIDEELKKNINKLDILNSLLFTAIYKINCDEEFVLLQDDKECTKIKKQIDKNKAIYENIGKVIEMAIPKIEKTLNLLKNN